MVVDRSAISRNDRGAINDYDGGPISVMGAFTFYYDVRERSQT
ncbi:hypothetical protein RMSM_06965 [Rhodopirellula maiorica SM1]|uniref:Uncharacterized protein n=1 Tax=Rhodopirellula maiorica SM1 TaxID=1265738 RepID=M5RAL8_9BACT|nr:hypothetical protein RMSM_06965 [Rhodopirellula maiorica SM1]